MILMLRSGVYVDALRRPMAGRITTCLHNLATYGRICPQRANSARKVTFFLSVRSKIKYHIEIFVLPLKELLGRRA